MLVPLLLLVAAALPGEPPRLHAVRTSEAPVVDGRLDDRAWAGAVPSDAFTQKFPDEGTAPTERTVVRVLYDGDSVYVGLRCDQARAPLVRRMVRRDREIEADRVSVTVDSRGDGQSAFRFDVTVDGVLADGIYHDDDEFSREWDESWDAATSVDGGGWSAELRIPLRVLRFQPSPVQSWGFNVRRFITARQEIAEWAYVPRTESGVVSRLGRLESLNDLGGASSLELRPFVVAHSSHRDADAGGEPGMAVGASAGLDAKWHATPNLAVDVTVNPDFGQVEADEVELNLTTYETEYPEKRPFFLEGTDVFSTPLMLLYTRRIGGVPAGPAREEGERLVAPPQPTQILGAMKAVGRLVPRLSIGALAALTAENRVDVADETGVVQARTAQPMTAYAVLRLRHDPGANGHLGLLATSTNRLGAGDEIARDAHVAAVDGRWRSRGGEYQVAGQAGLSAIGDGPSRTLRDGTVVAPGDVAPLAEASVAKIGGAHWLWSVDSEVIGEKADITDLGYLERQNRWETGAELGFRTTRPWWWTVETETGVEVSRALNLDGVVIGGGVELGTEWRLPSFWEIGLGVAYDPAHFDDREVGDGTAIERPAERSIGFELETDPRSPIAAMVEASRSWLAGGGHAYEAEAAVKLRLIPALDLELGGELEYRAGEPRFIAAESDGATTTYLLGSLRAWGGGPVLRAMYTFTPRLTLQAYGQLFLATRRYSDFRSFSSTAPRPRVRLAALAPAGPPVESQDEDEAAFNVNVLLRWEYALGSTAYLVYTRAEEPRLGAAGALDVRRLRRGPAAQALMLKLSYLWG